MNGTCNISKWTNKWIASAAFFLLSCAAVQKQWKFIPQIRDCGDCQNSFFMFSFSLFCARCCACVPVTNWIIILKWIAVTSAIMTQFTAICYILIHWNFYDPTVPQANTKKCHSSDSEQRTILIKCVRFRWDHYVLFAEERQPWVRFAAGKFQKFQICLIYGQKLSSVDPKKIVSLMSAVRQRQTFLNVCHRPLKCHLWRLLRS